MVRRRRRGCRSTSRGKTRTSGRVPTRQKTSIATYDQCGRVIESSPPTVRSRAACRSCCHLGGVRGRCRGHEGGDQRGRDAGLLDRPASTQEVGLGELLDEAARPGGGEEPADLLQVVVVEVAPEEADDLLPLRRSARVGEEGRLLAGAEVGGGALAGDRRVAEDADDVVEELEGDAERAAGLAQPGDGRLVRPRERSPCLQG